MEKVPPLEEREALLDALAELVEKAGPETFVSAPILEPSDRHFPDRWERNSRGVSTLARRLLIYAGLGDLGVEVVLGDGTTIAEDGEHAGAAAWFYGIEDDVCLFGASLEQLADAENLVGVMAHEIAHAWRARRSLIDPDRDREERLTDLSTIYLGFGVLTTNNTHRYRAKGELVGNTARTTWVHQSSGYLSPQAMGYLLACQTVARASSPSEMRRVAGLLSPNQAACFRASCELLDAGELARRLDLPDRRFWPAVVSPAPAPLEVDDEPLEDVLAPPPLTGKGWNDGQPVCRVIGRLTVFGLIVGCCLGLALYAIFAMRRNGDSDLPAAVFLGFPVLGTLVGRFLRHDICSGTDCLHTLRRGDTVCRFCGGIVTRTIARLADRLEN